MGLGVRQGSGQERQRPWLFIDSLHGFGELSLGLTKLAVPQLQLLVHNRALGDESLDALLAKQVGQQLARTLEHVPLGDRIAESPEHARRGLLESPSARNQLRQVLASAARPSKTIPQRGVLLGNIQERAGVWQPGEAALGGRQLLREVLGAELRVAERALNGLAPLRRVLGQPRNVLELRQLVFDLLQSRQIAQKGRESAQARVLRSHYQSALSERFRLRSRRLLCALLLEPLLGGTHQLLELPLRIGVRGQRTVESRHLATRQEQIVGLGTQAIEHSPGDGARRAGREQALLPAAQQGLGTELELCLVQPEAPGEGPFVEVRQQLRQASGVERLASVVEQIVLFPLDSDNIQRVSRMAQASPQPQLAVRVQVSVLGSHGHPKEQRNHGAERRALARLVGAEHDVHAPRSPSR